LPSSGRQARYWGRRLGEDQDPAGVIVIWRFTGSRAGPWPWSWVPGLPLAPWTVCGSPSWPNAPDWRRRRCGSTNVPGCCRQPGGPPTATGSSMSPRWRSWPSSAGPRASGWAWTTSPTWSRPGP